MEIGQGIEITEEIEMLAMLVDLGTFEIVEPDRASDIKVVYLMNDAVESFLIFENAVMTGVFDPDYEEELDGELTRDGEKYVLVVRQAERIFTIFFESLKKEVHVYNYGNLGHFWVDGYEYLRLMEYRLAILRDKVVYLGEEYSTEEEAELALITEFPPLNYCCYAAAPPQYVIPKFPAWAVSEEAIDLMERFAEAAGDVSIKKMLRLYRAFSWKGIAKLIAWMLHRTKHAKLVDLISEQIKAAACIYPDRDFGEDGATLTMLYEKAEAKKAELERDGQKAEIAAEVPFTTARDSIGFKVFLMVWGEQGGNRIVRIEENTPDELETLANR